MWRLSARITTSTTAFRWVCFLRILTVQAYHCRILKDAHGMIIPRWQKLLQNIYGLSSYLKRMAYIFVDAQGWHSLRPFLPPSDCLRFPLQWDVDQLESRRSPELGSWLRHAREPLSNEHTDVQLLRRIHSLRRTITDAHCSLTGSRLPHETRKWERLRKRYNIAV